MPYLVQGTSDPGVLLVEGRPGHYHPDRVGPQHSQDHFLQNQTALRGAIGPAFQAG